MQIKKRSLTSGSVRSAQGPRPFIEAVVEPLTEAVDKLVAAAHIVDRDEPLTPERQIETMNRLYRQLIAAFNEIIPLLGLVLFGDPKVAQALYREHVTVAMERLGAAWQEVEARYGIEPGSHDVTARTVTGIALLLALERRNNDQFDLDRAVALASEGTCNGFFPIIAPEHPRR